MPLSAFAAPMQAGSIDVVAPKSIEKKEASELKQDKQLEEKDALVETDEKLDSLAKIEKNILSLIDRRDPKDVIFVLPLEEMIIRRANLEFYIKEDNYKSLKDRAFSSVRESKLVYFNELALMQYPQIVIDEGIVDLINKVQSKGASVIIFTPNSPGPFNKIPYLEQWTFDFLKSLNIDLAKGNFADAKIVLKKYLTATKGSYPTFYQGLLSCSTKNDVNVFQLVLATLFVETGKVPSTIILLHNDKQVIALTGVQLRNVKRDIEFIGFYHKLPRAEIKEISPQKYMEFWKNFAKKLDAVTRDNIKEDSGNPYEHE